MPNKMKSNNPPRRVDIRGQDHLLAYITPAEAQLLMDNGGSGEPGPMGIPSFPDYGGPEGFGGGSNDGDGPSGGSGGTPGLGGSQDVGSGYAGPTSGSSGGGGQARANMQETLQAYAAEQAAAQAAIDQDIAEAEAVRADQARMAAELASRPAAGLTRAQYSAMPGYMKAVYDQVGAYNFDIDPVTERVTGFTGPSVLGFMPGIAGLLTSLMPEPTTEADLGGFYTGFGRGPGEGPQGDGREVVPTQTNPVTGQEECPEGYVFDADIQACRVSAPLANVGETVGGDGFTYEPGTYARMGLLDVAPEDLGGFASTYGTGFMTPEEFEAANLEYRRRAGTQAGIFQDPYNLQGYTLLA